MGFGMQLDALKILDQMFIKTLVVRIVSCNSFSSVVLGRVAYWSLEPCRSHDVRSGCLDKGLFTICSRGTNEVFPWGNL